MYQRILHDQLRFPHDMSTDARRLIAALLDRDPSRRLGTNGAEEIKKMPFFSKIDWKRLLQMKIMPPFKPSVVSSSVLCAATNPLIIIYLLNFFPVRAVSSMFRKFLVSVPLTFVQLATHTDFRVSNSYSNFDPEFTSEQPSDSVVEDSNISQTVQDQFAGFTYNPANEALNGGHAQYGSVLG